MVAAVGDTETVTAGMIVTLAAAFLLVSAMLVAVTVTVCELVSAAGAEYRPVLEIVPTAGLTDHVTPLLVVPITVAVNCLVCPAERLTVAGNTLTVTGGASTDIPEAELACLPVASWICKVNLYEPDADGVPATVPPLASVMPGGRLPVAIDHAYGAVPPVSDSVAL
jgi:hypothetical protein